jgi:hypothetical protein
MSVFRSAFFLNLHFFAKSLSLLTVTRSFIEAIAGSSCVANFAVSSVKVVVVLFDVGGRWCR